MGMIGWGSVELKVSRICQVERDVEHTADYFFSGEGRALG